MIGAADQNSHAHYRCHPCRIVRTKIISPSMAPTIMILTFIGFGIIVSTSIAHITAFSVSDVLSSSRSSFVNVVPSHHHQQLQRNLPMSTFHHRNEPSTNHISSRNRYSSSSSSSSSIRRMSTIPNAMLLTSTNPYYPLLNVALDQPLYTPIRRSIVDSSVNFLLSRINFLMNSIMGYLPAILHTFHSLVPSNAMTLRLIKYAFIVATVYLCSKIFLNKSDVFASTVSSSTTVAPLPSNIKAKDVVPMPFDQNVNEGWSICKLHSIVPYGVTSTTGTTKSTRVASSPYLQITMTLPKPNYVLPLQLGQPIHICGLDRNGNAIQAEFYPFYNDPSATSVTRSQPTPGYFSVLVPNPSLYNNDAATIDLDENSKNNDRQQRRVVQLLQDYQNTGDTEIAIHPGATSKLQYRGTHYPVTEIIYLVIGSTGIVPVLDQARTVLHSSSSSTSKTSTPGTSSGVERISVVWITSTIQEFDALSDSLKVIYEKFPTQLAVSCGVEKSLQSSMTQEIAAEYFFDNNIEINDTIPSFQPGMMAIISVEGIPHTSASLLRKVATTYLQRQKQFPNDCLCVL